MPLSDTERRQVAEELDRMSRDPARARLHAPRGPPQAYVPPAATARSKGTRGQNPSA